ncbi:MAG: DUF3656 domain-containing protein [Cyanobacteria bacterium J06614_10]
MEGTEGWICPELLAPAGSWDCAKAAVENGADAIYFGLDKFNARMRAENFTVDDLPELMSFLHGRGVRGYITLNTLIFPQEVKAAAHYLRTVIAAGVDAAIVQDIGLCRLIRHLSPDFPIHASTQMTITSAAGVSFAKQLGCHLVVLARECSLKEINKIQRQMKAADAGLPLETFVHGALCVAYSGQCLTSESLGGRSANRGECAQACRMTYDLISDGEKVELGDRAYLLSPQDLSGLPVIPNLIQAGVTSLKIEGRLKTPEYVASVTRVYRQALTRAIANLPATTPTPDTPNISFSRPKAAYTPSPAEKYTLEMSFSRGLSTGWFQGIDNQQLVHARFGKKRGAYIGQISSITRQGKDTLLGVVTQTPVKPGDGVVVDSGNPEADQGGRLYRVETKQKETFIGFGRRDVNLQRISVGDRLWKTNDPELDKTTRRTYSGDQPKFKRPITISLTGAVGEALTATAQDSQGHSAIATSDRPLVAAHSQPLTSDRLQQQFARLGNTPFELAALTNHLPDGLMLPVSALNQLRRELVAQLMQQRTRRAVPLSQPEPWTLNPHASHRDLLPEITTIDTENTKPTQLIPFVRTQSQLKAVLGMLTPSVQQQIQNNIESPNDSNQHTIYCEFEDPVKYKEAVQAVAKFNDVQGFSTDSGVELFIAPPRIIKPSENYILEQVKKAKASGYLIRNYDQLAFFAGERCVGDFSLNVANPLTARYYKQTFYLERVCASYDLNVQQLESLLSSAPAHWFEITLHQHMPMFHMEHCVFCAFLSTGTDFTNCGRPCEKHSVKLRDRTGTEHILQADAGCRNTVFNGRAQTGAEFLSRFIAKGARAFRIEFLDESPAEVTQTLSAYRQLLQGDISGEALWQSLNLSSQLGVTRGSLEKRHR